jgi:hypothetical protein
VTEEVEGGGVRGGIRHTGSERNPPVNVGDPREQ